MNRYKITIEYDGTGLAGWQRQENAPSVQQHIEEAIHNFSGERVNILCAGRTDAGVHAMGQVAHFELAKAHLPKTVQGAINYYLKPAAIAVVACEAVSEAFHARFSALRRHYLYRIINREAPLVLDARRAWHVKKALNVTAMQEAANLLIGHHDFTSFRAVACQAKSPMKTLERLEVSMQGAEIHIAVSAPSFLHHMVRNLVGTLTLVGEGKWQPDDVRLALEAKDRSAAGITAPAHGLYFMKVEYPPTFLPAHFPLPTATDDTA
jgi:tRNA pseudouridine38-40 synthase